jgi:RNA polymerase sigma-70 factor (ECF subfamily)
MAEDLTQDCFSKAYRGWQGFRGECSVSTWLRRIAANVMHDFVQDKRVQFWRQSSSIEAGVAGEWLADDKPSAEQKVVMNDCLQDIWQAAQLVSAKQQVAFALRYSEDMEVHEIASVMGITEGAAKVHLFRAVQTIRRKLC